MVPGFMRFQLHFIPTNRTTGFSDPGRRTVRQWAGAGQKVIVALRANKIQVIALQIRSHRTGGDDKGLRFKVPEHQGQQDGDQNRINAFANLDTAQPSGKRRESGEIATTRVYC